jgi:hypothetical protein
MLGGNPGDFDGCESTLQTLQEAHEVPDGEHVGFHEDAKVRKRLYRRVRGCSANRFCNGAMRFSIYPIDEIPMFEIPTIPLSLLPFAEASKEKDPASDALKRACFC